jgi:3D (Asp-Asp-Asp) domain-containing protein
MTRSATMALIFLAALGAAQPAQTNELQSAHFTLYYATRVTPISAGGIQGKVKSVAGEWLKYRLTRRDTSRANMQGTVYVETKGGKKAVASIQRVGVWKLLAERWQGKGNKSNPLQAYTTIAADQKVYPYGSRIYLPDADGFKTPGGRVLDGYFWVADVGGGIKGPLRFDVFVGTDATFANLKQLGISKWRARVAVEKLPKVPKEWNPASLSGIARILRASGCQQQPASNPVKKARRRAVLRSLSEPLRSCLVSFQKRIEQIPAIEHGLPHGAVTLWYLTQAALAHARKQ